MNYIDFIIILLLIFSAIGGASKGFIYELASLIALILGVWGAIKFSNATETFLTEQLNWHFSYINIIAFLITLAIIVVFIHFIAKAVEKAVETIQLSALNKIFGLVFSVFKSAFLLGILFILVDRLDEAIPIIPEKPIRESRLYTPLRNMAIYSFPFLKGLYEDIAGEFKDDDKQDDQNKKERKERKERKQKKEERDTIS